MGLLDKIFTKGAKELTDSVGGVIDKFVTTDSEKLKAKAELSKIVLDKLNELASFQKDVILSETQGNTLQRNWRPIVMLAFSAIVVYGKFIAPAFDLPSAPLETEFWGLLELGIGGYVIGRTAEKITTKVTDNIDMSFLKKKDRKTD